MKDGRTDHQDVCPRADEFFKILEVNSAFHLKSEVQASVLTKPESPADFLDGRGDECPFSIPGVGGQHRQIVKFAKRV
jgi:hypothetical protein